MSERFVADASIGVAWVHPAQATPQTEALLQAVYDGAVVEAPALWPLEIANALLVLIRRKKLSADERQRSLIALQGLSVELDYEMSSLAFAKLSTLAVEHRLTVYDAAYLELALRKKLPLGCKDGPLREAAKRCHLKAP